LMSAVNTVPRIPKPSGLMLAFVIAKLLRR
jgi:hypothetical protein